MLHDAVTGVRADAAESAAMDFARSDGGAAARCRPWVQIRCWAIYRVSDTRAADNQEMTHNNCEWQRVASCIVHRASFIVNRECIMSDSLVTVRSHQSQVAAASSWEREF